MRTNLFFQQAGFLQDHAQSKYSQMYRIASGGQAYVAAALDKRTCEIVALKVCLNQEMLPYIKEEVRLLKRLDSHANIVKFISAEWFPSSSQIALEYCPNTLRNLIMIARGECSVNAYCMKEVCLLLACFTPS